MNKKVSKIVSKLFLCLIMATNFCVHQVVCLTSQESITYELQGDKINSSDGNIVYVDANDINGDSMEYSVTLLTYKTQDAHLTIPVYVQATNTENVKYYVFKIDKKAFSECTGLKYIKLEHTDETKNDINHINKIYNDNKQQATLDFSELVKLEAIYTNCSDVSNIRKIINQSDDTKILTYLDLSSKTINVQKDSATGELFTYGDGGVTISFDNIIPGEYSGYDYKSYPGYGYKITRSYANSGGDDKIFDSNDEKVSNFSVSEGKVTFTDKSIEQTGKEQEYNYTIEQTRKEQEYNYTITAYDPFEKSVESKEDILVKIPANTVSNPTPQPATPNKPSTIRPSNPVITPPTDNSQDEDNDEDETPKPETEILEPNENIHEEAEKVTNQEIDNTENNYQTGDILTKKILIITSIVFIIASISLWIIFNKKRKN